MTPKDSYKTVANSRAKERKSHVSFPQLRYPSLREESVRDPALWLVGKSLDDGAEGLWRVHDCLYDLNTFIEKHPGGKDWLELTKGTDITEAFESHHLNETVRMLLSKFYVRDAKSPRNSPFTFEDDGFYRTFKAIAREKLMSVPKTVTEMSCKITDAILIALFTAATLSCFGGFGWKILNILVASLCLCWLTVCAHNFIHRKDNWRMYLFNLSLESYRDFRISHALSHHQFPNTLMDWEISSIEQLYPWLPRSSKSSLTKLGLLLQLPSFPLLFFLRYGKKIYLAFTRENFFFDHWRWHDFIAFVLPAWMYIISGASIFEVVKCWAFIITGGSFFFFCIAFNAAHHHPDIFHDGDEVRSTTIDYGLHQLEAVMDRTGISTCHSQGKAAYFRVLTHFGDHALHHLLPTVDHASLAHLYPIFLKHCEKYKANFRMTTQFDLFLGQLKQLAKTEPNVLE